MPGSLSPAQIASLISLRKLPQCYWWNHSDSTLEVIASLLDPSRAALAKYCSVALGSYYGCSQFWGKPQAELPLFVFPSPGKLLSGLAVTCWPCLSQAGVTRNPVLVSLFHFRCKFCAWMPRATYPPSSSHFCHLPKTRWFLFTCFFSSHLIRVQTVLI